MSTRFYVSERAFGQPVDIRVHQLDDDADFYWATRTNALPQMTRQDLRVMLNTMMNMLSSSKYEMYAIQVTGSREITGYEVVVHDPDLALQFKLTWC